MLLLLVYLVGTRTRDPHEMPRARSPEVAEASVPDAASSASAVVSSSAQPTADAAPPPLAPAPHALHVVTASWEAVATLLAANGGVSTTEGSAVRKAGLDVQVEVLATQHDVEDRLARGGGEGAGADAAVMWLPTMVACDERLGALSLQAFFVAGWSRGREVLLASDPAILTRPRAARETLVYAQDEGASTLAAFALGQVTTPPTVRVVHDADAGAFAALARPLPADRPASAPSKTVLSTAEASHLVPLVAVAPQGFVDGHAALLASLVRAWLEGEASARKDVTAVVRRIASEPGAPDPASMIERLGWMETSDEADDARALLAPDPPAIGVRSLYRMHAALLEGAGVLSIHPRDRAVVARAPLEQALGAAATPSPPGAVAAPAADARVWLAHRVDSTDPHAAAREVGTLAAIFDRSAVRVSARPPSLAKDIAAAVHDDVGLPDARVVVAPGPPADAASKVLLEVLAAP
jgi:hypothetical protein